MEKEITNTDLLIKIVEIENTINDVIERQNQKEESLKEMLDAFNAAKGAFIALEWLAKVVKPMIYLAGIIGTLYVSFKGIKL